LLSLPPFIVGFIFSSATIPRHPSPSKHSRPEVVVKVLATCADEQWHNPDNSASLDQFSTVLP
jgi:hypothetical protein